MKSGQVRTPVKTFFLEFVLICFVFQTLVPKETLANAMETEKFSAPSTFTSPSANAGNILQSSIGSQDEAIKFGQDLIHKIHVEEAQTHKKLALHAYHIQGVEPDSYFTTILEVVSKAGIPIEGTIITKERFDQQLADLGKGSSLRREMSHILLKYERAAHVKLSQKGQRKLRHIFSPSYSQIKEFGNRVFGLPYGLTFYEHFVQEDQNGNRARRFPRDWNISLQSLLITLGGMANLSLALLVNGMRPNNIHFWLPNLVLAAWVPLFVYFQREVSSFRLQGRSVLIDETAPPGSQILVTDNKSLFTFLVIAQEWLLNLILVPAIFGTYKLAQVANSLLNGTLGAYGSIYSEHWKGSLFMQAEQAGKEGNHELEKKLANRAKWINLIWFMIVFPFFKNIEFLTGPTTWLALPFILLGTAFFIQQTLLTGKGPIADRIGKNLKRFSSKPYRKINPENNQDLLFIKEQTVPQTSAP